MDESTALAPVGAQAITFRTVEEISGFAKAIAQSAFVPAAFKGKPGDVMAAIMYGLERGLTPMTSLQNIAVINGKPSVYGDLLLGMCLSDPSCEYIKEADTQEISTSGVAWCEAKRRGKALVRRTFSLKEAQHAGLTSKPGPWKEYPSRMLMMRARSWCLRDAFADRLLGLQAREEAQDIIDVTPEPLPAEAPKAETPAPQAAPDQKGENELRAATVKEISALLVRAHPGDGEGAMQAKRNLVSECFGCKWKELNRQPVAALQAGLMQLREALAPETQGDAEEDVPFGEAPAEGGTASAAPSSASGESEPSGLATAQQIAGLTLLAQQVGADAQRELEDTLRHYPAGLPLHSYEVIHAHLLTRRSEAKQGALV